MYGNNKPVINIVTCRRGGDSNKPPRDPGSDKTRGQGSYGLLTGGLNLTSTGEPPTCGVTERFTYVKYLDRANLVITTQKFKKKNGLYTGPVLLRQGEPGTSQYDLIFGIH